MTKRSGPTLLYAGTSARRWVQVAITTPDAELLNLCVSKWRRSASPAAAEEAARALWIDAVDVGFDARRGPRSA